MMESLKAYIADLLLPARGSASDLDRLIAAAGNAHLAARRSLALAVAEEDREISRRVTLSDQVKDLEVRAIDAFAHGREDLATRAAETIAVLETEVAASEAASTRFAAKVAATRREVDAQRGRLADLDRGRRLARVGAALSGPSSPRTGQPILARAEAALVAVQAAESDAEALRLEFAPTSQTLVDDLAEAGFGRPTRVVAADVMTRLRALASHALPQA